MNDTPLRQLPAVHALLAHPGLAGAIATRGREAVAAAVRRVLDEARAAIRSGGRVEPDQLIPGILTRLESDRPALRPVLNATGILLHTGLGRAPLADEAVAAIAGVARGYCNLELDLETGARGRRTSAIAALLREITGAEAAAVVNNNAAATVLALKALAAGREVVVSRGQLVEIGGSFRLPEIFEVSGARLREVGTTNRTRLGDYERAISPATAALLRVHASNFRIVGFTESVSIAELAALGKARGLWTIDDIGSGALAPGLPPLDLRQGAEDTEPTIAGSLAAGADLVLASGDKLLGGPQCGLLLGSKAAVDRVATDPMMRALRVDKLTLAALEATLRLMREPDRAPRRIPLWAFLTAPLESLRARAEGLAAIARTELGLRADVTETAARFGGGSAPAASLPSVAVRLRPPFPDPIGSERDLARALRLGDPPVVPRVQGGAVLLDLRAVPAERDEELILSLRALPAPGASGPSGPGRPAGSRPG